MELRVHIPVFGSGLGHASRMALIGTYLTQRGATVHFSSSFEAPEFLRKMGFSCNKVPGMDISWNLDGSVSVKETMRSYPVMLSTLLRQVKREVLQMKSFGPDVVLSDSRLSGILAAKILGIPTIVVLNQLKLLFKPGRIRQPIPFFEGLGAEFMGTLWSLSEKILVPDLPPPYTLSEAMLWGVHSAQDKLRYVGFLANPPHLSGERVGALRRRLELYDQNPIAFAQISGPSRTKDAITRILLESASIMTGRYHFIISAGQVGGSTEPTRIRGGWYYEWCNDTDELFDLADVLILRGGHSSLSRGILAGKPIVTIPIPNHSEQTYNARKIAMLGLGIYLEQKMVNPRSLADAIYRLTDDNSFRVAVLSLRKYANSFDGVAEIGEAVLRTIAR